MCHLFDSQDPSTDYKKTWKCKWGRSCADQDCILSHPNGRDVVDAAISTLVKCGVVLREFPQVGALSANTNDWQDTANAAANDNAYIANDSSRMNNIQAHTDTYSHNGFTNAPVYDTQVTKSSAEIWGASSFACMPTRNQTEACIDDLCHLDWKNVNVNSPESVLDCCVGLLYKAGGEASVWFMGEVYKRMPHARDEIASYGGLKSFCNAHSDVLVYKAGLSSHSLNLAVLCD